MSIAQPFGSARLRMRALSVADASALHPAYRDADTMRYWSSAPHETMAQTIAYLTVRDDPAARFWTITRAVDDEVVGTVTAITRREGVVEVGYMLVPASRGHGYAREAVAALIDLLVKNGTRRIFADVDPDNAGSIALLASLGFMLEGRLRGEWHTHIGVRDSLIYGLLRDEWLDAAGRKR